MHIGMPCLITNLHAASTQQQDKTVAGRQQLPVYSCDLYALPVHILCCCLQALLCKLHFAQTESSKGGQHVTGCTITSKTGGLLHCMVDTAKDVH